MRSHWCLVLTIAIAGCLPVPKGTRPVTATDRSLALVQRFACQAPTNFRVDDHGASEIAGAAATLELRRDDRGLVLIEAGRVTTNHWTDGAGDHFVSWYPSSNIATETIIAADHSSVVQGMYMGAASVGGLDLQPGADGVVRARGIPMLGLTCVAVDADWDAQSHPPILALEAAKPVGFESVKPIEEFDVTECTHDNGHSWTDPGDSWAWLPSHIFLVAEPFFAYVRFGGLAFGNYPLFEVPIVSGEHGVEFGMTIGKQYALATIRVNGNERHIELSTSPPPPLPDPGVVCSYVKHVSS